MASPSVVGAPIEGAITTAAYDFTPTFTQTTGNLVVIVIETAVSVTLQPDGAYSQLEPTNPNELARFFILYRQLTGIEGGQILISAYDAIGDTIVTKACWVSYNITGHINPATTPPEKGTLTTATSNAPLSPALTPAGGSKDYLFLAAFGQNGEEADDDTWQNNTPTGTGGGSYAPSLGYQTTTGITGAATVNCQVCVASRAYTGTVETPTVWSTDQSLAWRAQTVAIYPAGVAQTGQITAVQSGITYDRMTGRLTAAQGNLTYTQKTGRITAANSVLTYDRMTGRIAAAQANLTYNPVTAGMLTAIQANVGHTEVWYILPAPGSPTAYCTLSGQYKNEWTNPTNAYTSNGVYATSLGNDPTKDEQDYYAFDLSAIPSDAIIKGIRVYVYGSCSYAGAVMDLEAQLLKYYPPALPPPDPYIEPISGIGRLELVGSSITNRFTGTTDTLAIYGGQEIMWGGTLRRADVVRTNFGVYFRTRYVSGTDGLRVDYVAMDISYTTPAILMGGFIVRAHATKGLQPSTGGTDSIDTSATSATVTSHTVPKGWRSVN